MVIFLFVLLSVCLRVCFSMLRCAVALRAAMSILSLHISLLSRSARLPPTTTTMPADLRFFQQGLFRQRDKLQKNPMGSHRRFMEAIVRHTFSTHTLLSDKQSQLAKLAHWVRRGSGGADDDDDDDHSAIVAVVAMELCKLSFQSSKWTNLSRNRTMSVPIGNSQAAGCQSANLPFRSIAVPSFRQEIGSKFA